MEGLIRKIVVGKDPKNAMAYYVGMRAGSGEVSAIVEDDRHLHKFGKQRYLIYIENEEGTMLWKSIDEMSCVLEYDLNFWWIETTYLLRAMNLNYQTVIFIQDTIIFMFQKVLWLEVNMLIPSMIYWHLLIKLSLIE